MGIQGLLPLLKKATKQTNIKVFKGCTVAIDSYCWLHKGAFACAEKLALGEKTDQYVHYCMKYVNNLLANDIKPIMVFDGCSLPSKRDVEKTRRERRELNRKKAAQFLREGKRAEARDALTKCLDVTPQMALELMNMCRNKGVDCIVAPYEADAQLAFLARAGIAQVIITEDSDLLLFGCERVMYKMDFNGNGMLIENRFLNDAIQLGDNYTFEKFLYICILSGCDYLASLPGIGLVKATKVFKLTRQSDMRTVLKKLPRTLNMNNLTVPIDYIEGFFKACNTFRYQLIFDPLKRKIGPLNPYEPDVDPSDLYYAGPPMDNEKACQIALGNLDIHNGDVIADFDPDSFVPKYKKAPTAEEKNKLHMLSIWNKHYRPRPKIAMSNYNKEPDSVQRCSTKGKEMIVSNPVIKKMSPFKRKRCEDLEPVYDKEEFMKMYSVPNEAPIAKKSKLEIEMEQDSDFISGLFSSQIGAENVENEQKNSDGYQSEPSVKSVAKDQQMSEYSVDQVKCNSPLKDNPSPEKGRVTTPKQSKNVFSVGSSGEKKREKFSLNATKKDTTEVKSRFFTTKQPLRKTAFFDSLKVELGEESQDVETRTMEVKSEQIEKTAPETEQINKNPVPEAESGSAASSLAKKHNTESSSPYQSFGFKKILKMDKFKSKFDSKHTPNSVQSSQAARTQFKPVIDSNPSKSTMNCEGHIKLESVSQTIPSIKSVDCGIKTSNNILCDERTKDTENSMENKSDLYSVDSSSLKEDCDKSSCFYQKVEDRIVDSENTPPSATNGHQSKSGIKGSSKDKSVMSFFKPASKNRFSYPDPVSGDNEALRNTERDLSEKTCSHATASSCSPSSSAAVSTTSGTRQSPSEPRVPGKPKLMAGCRGPGLAKTKGKMKSPQDDSQATISKYFNNMFSYKKPADKIPVSRKPLSPSKNNVSDITPEGDPSRRVSASAKVQRKLHLSD